MDLDTRKQLAEQLRGREVRRFAFSDFELRDVGGILKFDGFASVVESPYDMGYYQETIKRGAFTKTLSESPDVQMLINHEGLPIARTGRNLTLTEEHQGLRTQADLNPALPRVQEFALTAGDGLIDQMSYAFRATRNTWNDDYTERDIAECDINRGDVSIVNQGANPATSFSLRDLMLRFELPGTEQFAMALSEVRAGKTLSDSTLSTLQRVLDLIDASDTNVDKALIALSDLMGVTNPDVAQDAALDRSKSLDLYRARAFALRSRIAS